MTEQLQNNETEQLQEPIVIQLTLNLEQINFVLGSLGKLPTESGAWVLRQIIGQQAQQQIETLGENKEETSK
jgi:hypothetical protein